MEEIRNWKLELTDDSNVIMHGDKQKVEAQCQSKVDIAEVTCLRYFQGKET